MTPDEIREHITAFVAALSQDDWSHAIELYSRTASEEATEQFRRDHAEFREAFSDYRATIEELVVDGNKAVVWSTVRGTHVGEFAGGELVGLPPTGKTAIWEEIWLIEYDNAGQVVGGRWMQDQLGRLRQLQGDPAAG